MSEVFPENQFDEGAGTQSQVQILPPAQRPSVPPEALAHRELRGGPFWQRLPAYADVSEEDFLDHQWQAKNSITTFPRLLAALEGLVSPGFIHDVEQGFRRAPMPVRVSPYLMSLIDWTNPFDDPIRIQFLPLLSRRMPDHNRIWWHIGADHCTGPDNCAVTDG